MAGSQQCSVSLMPGRTEREPVPTLRIDARTGRTDANVLNLIDRAGPGKRLESPESLDIDQVWRDVWLPAFEGAPTLAKFKRELFEYAMLLRAIVEDQGDSDLPGVV